MLFESEVTRRITIAKAKLNKPVDIFEAIPLFGDIENKRDKDDLKKVLKEEKFEAGDVLFNYSTLHIDDL